MRLKKSALILVLSIAMQQWMYAQNITISNEDNPNEPSIMMDPNNTDILVAGANLNSCYISSDGGATWEYRLMSSSHGVWGDPTIDVDADGNFYFFHLSNPASGNWIDRIVCQKTNDNGDSWTDGSYTGLNGSKAQDKQWSVIDRTNNNIYLTWTQFDNYGSSSPADSSIILFSKSLDQGDTWSEPMRINKVAGDCIDEDNTVEGATPAMGPNGEIYVAWAGPSGIVFNRSLDQGDTWLEQEILVDPMPTGWDYMIPDIYRANGLPVCKCDLSGGDDNGTIYINWSDQRNGSDDTDIWLAKSVDGGDTWSDPIRVNDDPAGNQQFFTWMDIDQSNGNLYFVFYDRRNHDNSLTDVYLAISNDGGESFSNHKISESPFSPISSVFFGDYTNIVAHNNIIRPIWTRLDLSQLSVVTNITPLSEITAVEDNTIDDIDLSNYPNPSSDITYLSFKLHEDAVINISIYDMEGKLLHKVYENTTMTYGKYVLPIDLKKLDLKSAAYLLKLWIDDESVIVRTVVVD